MLVTQEDFLFGTQSALQYEEFNVLKRNRHKVFQKRVLVISGNDIYHQKQLIDPKSGTKAEPINNLPNVQAMLQDDKGQIISSDQLDQSEISLDTSGYFGETGESGDKKKEKKVGYYKAKISNLMKTGISG